MTPHPVSLFPVRRTLEVAGATIPRMTLAERLTENQRLAEHDAQDALSTLLEGAQQAMLVTDPAVAQLLPPAVCDALRRLAEHTSQQAQIIRRLLP